VVQEPEIRNPKEARMRNAKESMAAKKWRQKDIFLTLSFCLKDRAVSRETSPFSFGFRIWAVLLLIAAISRSSAKAAEPLVTAQDLPRVPAVEPKGAPKTFRVKPDFHLELVASEPNVCSPVALSFDERGRMFVVEMIDYSERREQIPHLGRIRLLEDTDGDGVFDKSTVYADHLPWPTAVFCYGGGIFVIANPDILYLKNTKGDGKADVRELVFTGFAEGVERVNVQEMPNSLVWGLDNRVHGATSGNGGKIRSLRHLDAKRLDLNGHDFAIEPRTMTMTSEAGGGQHGLSFDNYGRRFTCNNSDHIRLFMYDERYAARNPFYEMPPALASIAVDGGAAEVYRISQEEPWRVVRTRWRIAGVMTGPVEGGGRSSGYFTGATGITLYRGNAFPEEFQGDPFVGECAFNLIHHKKLYPDDVGLKAQRPVDEQNVEFLASTDNWFRPVQFANAPDGSLYVIDMYREIVEHPWSLPESIKKFLDLNSGSERGRIYRIVPDGFKQTRAPRLDKSSTTELVSLLEHHNGWHRDTAARLIYERQDRGAIPALVKLQETSSSSLGRLHALYALAGLNGLEEVHVLKALNDPDVHLREHGIKLSERFLSNGIPSPALWERLHTLVNDPALNVRYQLAFTLGEVTHPGKSEALEQILRRDMGSRWVQAAVLSSLSNGAAMMLAHLCTEPRFGETVEGQDFLEQLLRIVGAKNQSEEVTQAAELIGRVHGPFLSFSLLRALGEGLQRAGSSLRKTSAEPAAARLFAQAIKVSADSQTAEATRLEAIRLLSLSGYKESGSTLLALLGADESQSIQLAAIATLTRFAEPQIGIELVRRWPAFRPQVRSSAIGALLSRQERAANLLQAIQGGGIQASELTTSQIQFLRNHHDPQIRRLAVQVFGPEKAIPRQKVVEQFQDALHLAGDAERGKEIYVQRCVSCHRLGSNGFALGPDLVTVKAAGKEKMLSNILDPSREVAPQYIAFEIQTKDGESSVGIIANETTSTITVLQAYGKSDVIPRAAVKSMRSLGQSLMPEGLEQGLTTQDLANLMEYIATGR
jgi:putative membrane-bound dehydrogenase-like protein